MNARSRPWEALYADGVPRHLEPEHRSALAMFRAAVERAPEQALVHYFGTSMSTREVDEDSDALAVAFGDLGVGRGDHVALYLQNVPQFVLAVLATWKAGGVVVPVNPMLRARELDHLLADSGARVLVCLCSLYESTVRATPSVTSSCTIVTTSELDYAVAPSGPLAGAVSASIPSGPLDLGALVAANRGRTPRPAAVGPDDVAFLTYTSGTTGPSKGAMNLHRNVVFNAQAYREWMRLTSDDVVLAAAPLFHITGLVAHLAVALLVPMPMVLAFRFDPITMLELIERHRPTFTVAAITAFVSLTDHADGQHDTSSLTKVFSGGAPIAPAVADRFERRFGAAIHNIYGLTETTSPTHAVPLGRRAPVDPVSGALSVGVPIFDTDAWIVDENGTELAPGEIGEIVVAGPQVVPGYWNRPAESAAAMPGGELHTGDVGFRDDDGWFFVVDRKKDLINASGFKVWPREVEDVLYEQPAVREAAVIGVPDRYRGETVKAYVCLRDGSDTDETALIAFTRERLAAYKCPTQVEIVSELPRTATGKVLRRELRDRERNGSAGGGGSNEVGR